MGRRRGDSWHVWFRKDRGGWYGNFRSFADVGGAVWALKPEGEDHATRDEDEAHRIAERIGKKLLARRRARNAGAKYDPRLSEYAARYLEDIRDVGDVSDKTFQNTRRALARFVDALGDPHLTEIGTRELKDYVSARLRERVRHRDGRGRIRKLDRTVARATVAKELAKLSALLRAAMLDEVAPPNHAVAAVRKRMGTAPKPVRPYLEPGECWRVMRAAQVVADAEGRRLTHVAVIVFTLALTGLRWSECAGLTRGDVDLGDARLRVRENVHRPRLKNEFSTRDNVPIWPQLADMLGPYLDRTTGQAGDLLFPGYGACECGRKRCQGRIANINRLLDMSAKEAGIMDACRAKWGERFRLRSRIFRHTFTSMRIQCEEVTIDPLTGERKTHPVPLLRIARELGHRDEEKIRSVYGHLMDRPKRGTVVEYGETAVIPLHDAGSDA